MLAWTITTLFTVFISILKVCDGFTAPLPKITPGPQLRRIRRQELDVNNRAIITEDLSTCGYQNGDPSIIRTAEHGFNCRVNTANGLWGFCTNTLEHASQCSMWGACIDSYSCSTGCGFTGREDILTSTCPGALGDFCSIALLTFGVDQVYSFVACGASATIEHYLISPTAEAAVSDATSTGNTEVSTSNKGESAATAAGDPAAQDTKDSKQNTGAIIGGVIGGLALVSIAVLAGIYMLRKNNRQQSTDLPADGIVYEAGNNEVYEPSKPEHQLRASEMSAPHSGGRTDCLSALME